MTGEKQNVLSLFPIAGVKFCFKDFISNSVSVCAYVHVNVGEIQRPGRGIGSPGAGVAGSREPRDLGAGNRTQVIGEGSRCF